MHSIPSFWVFHRCWSWLKFFDENINSHLQPVSASISETDPNVGRCTFSLKVPRSLCNAAGNLHGGVVATIFDMTTTMSIAPIARQGFWETGHVTRTLNCSYLRPAPEGTELLIECEVVHLGKRIGMLKGVMRRKDDGAVCYTCEHQKAVAEFKPKYKL
jgi:uncharacterized protein (TIGR00369 family)